MQIVINIPKDRYKRIIEHTEGIYDQTSLLTIIENGTLLPEGHGRLKDIDKIISDGMGKGFCDWYDEMQYADTIIEADKDEIDEGNN